MVESNKETMLSDLARFVLAYTVDDDALIYKRTSYFGNVKRERYVPDAESFPFCPEFQIETKGFYGRVEVTWWNTEESYKKHYTETEGA